jgi:hypothetical protein
MGQEYDAETVSEAILDAIIDRAPVAVMNDMSLRDGTNNCIRRALGPVTSIAGQDDTGNSITFERPLSLKQSFSRHQNQQYEGQQTARSRLKEAQPCTELRDIACQSQAFFLRLASPIPDMPMPRSARVPGSGQACLCSRRTG